MTTTKSDRRVLLYLMARGVRCYVVAKEPGNLIVDPDRANARRFSLKEAAIFKMDERNKLQEELC